MDHIRTSLSQEARPKEEALNNNESVKVLFAVPLSLLLFGVFAYFNALSNPFIFDDYPAIVYNPGIRSLTPLSETFRALDETPLAGRPVSKLSVTLNYQFSGLNPTGYRLTNLALHIINAWLVYAIVIRALSSPALELDNRPQARSMAWVIALVWMLHPLNTEVINYVTQRTELLLGLFYLLTILASQLAWEKPHIWTPLAAVFCAAGMASKESMVTAPVIIVLYDFCFSGKSIQDLFRSRRYHYVSLFSTWTVLAVLMWQSPRSTSVGYRLGIAWWEYALTQFWAIGRYLRLTVLPSDLLIDYGDRPQLELVQILPGALIVVALLSVAIACRNKSRPVFFTITAFFVNLAPTSSIVPIATEVGAERRVYLPLICATALTFCCVFKLLQKLSLWNYQNIWKSRPVLILFSTILILLGSRTVLRNSEYSSRIRLWEGAARIMPDNYRIHFNLAHAYLSLDQFQAALPPLQKSIELNPDNMYALTLLHQILTGLGSSEEAGSVVQKLLKLEVEDQIPYPADYWFLRGCNFQHAGKTAEAIHCYESAIQLSNRHIGANYNLGTILSETDPEKAIPHFELVIRLDPLHGDAYCNLGNARARLGQLEAAMKCYRRAVEINPGNQQAAENLRIVSELSTQQL